VLVRLIAQIVSRFGFVVSQKAAAQTILVIGALGGAAINYAFIDHIQSVARGHFTVRRLERKYGKDIVFNAVGQWMHSQHYGWQSGFWPRSRHQFSVSV
jgi:hypothetical protein